MNAHIDDSLSRDLTLVFGHLISQARNDTTLASALRRLVGQVQTVLDDDEITSKSTQTTDRRPTLERSENISHESEQDGSMQEISSPASGEKLRELLEWQNKEATDTEVNGVYIGGQPLTRANAFTETHHNLAEQCHLKALAATWRAQALLGQEDNTERQHLVNKASEANLFLWPLDSTQKGPTSSQPLDYQRFASTCDACTVALDAWNRLSSTRAAELLPLIAEAQSMMQVAAAHTGYTRQEATADEIHQWLRDTTRHQGVHVERYMKWGEAADPTQAEDLQERVLNLLKPTPKATSVERSDDNQGNEQEDNEPASPEVSTVRKLLEGKTVAMFCGDRRPEKHQKFIDAFGLQELLWEDTPNKYTSGDHDRIFNHPDLCLVIIAKGWLSHSHTYTLPKLAAERGIPVVRLPAGYGVNRVAYDILDQASEQLSS